MRLAFSLVLVFSAITVKSFITVFVGRGDGDVVQDGLKLLFFLLDFQRFHQLLWIQHCENVKLYCGRIVVGGGLLSHFNVSEVHT